MFHLTIFSGTEGELAASGATVLTVFGSAELSRPTLAQQLIHLRSQRGRRRGLFDRLIGSHESIVVTVFGSSMLRDPSIAEEYAALAAAVRSGQIERHELRGLMDELEAVGGARGALRTLTLMGACVITSLKAAKERKALDAAAESGAIDTALKKSLDALVETPRQVRWRLIGDLVLAH